MFQGTTRRMIEFELTRRGQFEKCANVVASLRLRVASRVVASTMRNRARFVFGKKRKFAVLNWREEKGKSCRPKREEEY